MRTRQSVTFTPPLIELKAVVKQYDAAGNTQATPVLQGVDLKISEGESVAIVGPSGSGKSTLLQIIGTLDRPTSGTVIMNGRDLAALPDNQLNVIRNQELGFVFQMHHLLPQCSVLENVLVPTLTGDTQTREPALNRATRLLKRVGLADRMNHRPGQLSGGERQRVAVVRALINEPKLLLADEPTGALDRASAENLTELLLEINHEEGITLLVITHSLPLAQRLSRILELRDGRLLPLD
jgi:ABC-type lipoprotein export system ATPase subunit